VKLRAIDNPPNPYLSAHAEWLVPPPLARLEVYEETAKSILSRNDSPDLPYTWSINPYRGCQHACSYCYARCTHEYLGFGAGTDFDTKLVAKCNAPVLLRQVFKKRSWQRDHVHFSGATDCYQPLEATYKLTRQCLQVCLEFGNPACVVTKGALVARDAELLAELDRRAGALVQVSIPFADADSARLIEPQTPPPGQRFEAVRRLRQAGAPVGVMVSPIIPGLSDRDIPSILEQAARAGACSASYSALRLPGSVQEVFVKRLYETMPLRAGRILARLRDIRGGKLDERRFGKRFRGEGVYWESIRDLFELHRRRVGLEEGCLMDESTTQMCTAVPRAARRIDTAVGQMEFEFGA